MVTQLDCDLSLVFYLRLSETFMTRVSSTKLADLMHGLVLFGQRSVCLTLLQTTATGHARRTYV